MMKIVLALVAVMAIGTVSAVSDEEVRAMIQVQEAIDSVRTAVPAAFASAAGTLSKLESPSADALDFVLARHADTMAVSTECQTALNALGSALTSNCSADLTALISPNATTYATDAAYVSFCTGTCGTDINTAIDNVKTQCADVTQADFADVSGFITALNNIKRAIELPCLTSSDGTYCYPAFYRGTTTAQTVGTLSADNLPTTEQMDSLCHPCFRRVIVAANVFGASSAAQLDAVSLAMSLLCLRRNNEYCYPVATKFFADQQNELANQGETSDPYAVFRSYVNRICGEPCVGAFIRKVFSTVGTGFSSNPILDLLFSCKISESGSRCSTIVLNRIKGLQNACQNDFPSTCGSSCKAAVAAVSSAGGNCCASSVYGWLGLFTSGTDAIKTFATDTCQVPALNGTDCQSSTFTTLKVFFENYTPATFDAAAQANLRAECASQYGLAEADVTLVSSGAPTDTTGGGASTAQTNPADTFFVEVKLDAKNDPNNNGVISESVNRDIANNNLPVTAVASAEASTRPKPLDDVTVDESSTTATTEGSTSPAAAASPAMFLFALVALVAVAF